MAASPTRAEVELARELRGLRERAGLTQTELSTIFAVSSASISSWENQRRPAPPPESRLEPYARLFTDQGTPPVLLDEEDLDDAHKDRRDALLQELQRLSAAARGISEARPTVALTYRSWFFEDDGPLVIVCPDAPLDVKGPLAEVADPNYTELHSYADLDALIELHGHIRAENDPDFPVFFKRASQVEVDDLSGHLVLLGGIAWNRLTKHLLRSLTRLPVRQIEVDHLKTGEIFAVGHGADEQHFEPTWLPEEENVDGQPVLDEDVALLARVRNPYNSARSLTLCNGVHSRGVYGAVRTLTDAKVRDANESYLAERFPGGEYAVIARVPVFRGKAATPDLRNSQAVLYTWPSAVPGKDEPEPR